MTLDKSVSQLQSPLWSKSGVENWLYETALIDAKIKIRTFYHAWRRREAVHTWGLLGSHHRARKKSKQHFNAYRNLRYNSMPRRMGIILNDLFGDLPNYERRSWQCADIRSAFDNVTTLKDKMLSCKSAWFRELRLGTIAAFVEIMGDNPHAYFPEFWRRYDVRKWVAERAALYAGDEAAKNEAALITFCISRLGAIGTDAYLAEEHTVLIADKHIKKLVFLLKLTKQDELAERIDVMRECQLEILKTPEASDEICKVKGSITFLAAASDYLWEIRRVWKTMQELERYLKRSEQWNKLMINDESDRCFGLPFQFLQFVGRDPGDAIKHRHVETLSFNFLRRIGPNGSLKRLRREWRQICCSASTHYDHNVLANDIINSESIGDFIEERRPKGKMWRLVDVMPKFDSDDEYTDAEMDDASANYDAGSGSGSGSGSSSGSDRNSCVSGSRFGISNDREASRISGNGNHSDNCNVIHESECDSDVSVAV